MKLSKDTNILIVGLGLLGGSYAEALTKKGYTVNAVTKEQSSVDLALEKGIINYGTTKLSYICALPTCFHRMDRKKSTPIKIGRGYNRRYGR